MDELGLEGLTCSYAIADFESNIKNCFLQVWPGITFRHCLFHFKQAIWRKVATSGMAKVYRTAANVVFRTFVKGVMSLPCVPLTRMPEAFEIIKTIGAQMKKLSHVKFFGTFTTYIQRQWIRDMDEAWLRSWNIFSKNGSFTNNAAEAYNRVFANTTYFINAHPPVFLWVKVVKQELVIALSESKDSIAGNEAKSKYNTISKSEEHKRIVRMNLMVQLSQHSITMQDYLTSMGNNVLQEDDKMLEDVEVEIEQEQERRKKRRLSHQNVSRK